MGVRAGTIIAKRYEVLGPLGRGGMGQLFRARNVRTERKVAVKLLRPDAKHRADAVERFRREAKAAGMINSDHVTQVLDVEDDPKHGIAIAFELLEGESLLQRLRARGAMDLRTIHPIVCAMLKGLQDAHDVGIIHRDLKPSNVFLVQRNDGSDLVKILDFGISKLPKSIARETLTEPNQSLGSFMFMPPEQIHQAEAVDERADLYAVGTLVFQAMTGHLPFPSSNIIELVRLKSEGAPRKLADASSKAFSLELEAWVAKALARQKMDRFGTAREMLETWEELAPRVSEPGPETLPQTPPPADSTPPLGASPPMGQPAQTTPRAPSSNPPLRTRGQVRTLVMSALPAPTKSKGPGGVSAMAKTLPLDQPLAIPSAADIAAAQRANELAAQDAARAAQPAAEIEAPNLALDGEEEAPSLASTSPGPSQPAREPKEGSPCWLVAAAAMTGFGAIAVLLAIGYFLLHDANMLPFLD